MRANEFLSEQIIDEYEIEGPLDVKPILAQGDKYNNEPGRLQPVKSFIPGLTTKYIRRSTGRHSFYMFNEADRCVGVFSYDDVNFAYLEYFLADGVKAVTPHMTLAPQLQNKGLATQFYTQFLASGPYVLMTSSHTKGANSLWNKLTTGNIINKYYFRDNIRVPHMVDDPSQIEKGSEYRAYRVMGPKERFKLKESVQEDVKKNRWSLLVADPEKHQWSDNLIQLVNNAYQNTSLGSFVQNASQVAASDWVALDWDPQPDLDCTVFYRKARPNENWTGYKIQGIGHDGKTESKQKVIQRVKALLTKPGVWIESSDAMARTLGKLGLQPVTDEQTLQQLFPGSTITILDKNGTYERDAGGTKIREQVYGNPIIK